MNRYISASEARNDFSGTVSRVAYGRERVVIQRRKEKVAVVPMEDLELLERLEREKEDRIDVAEANKVIGDENEGRVSWEDLKGELGL